MMKTTKYRTDKNRRTLAQYRQDLYILDLLGSCNSDNRRYFVEAGAYDGFKFSNTAVLQDHGWHGLLIEANPKHHESLLKRIKQGPGLRVEQCALTSKKRQAAEPYLQFKDADVYSSYIPAGKQKSRIVAEVLIRCHEYFTARARLLHEVFDEYNVPKIIDYGSFDVEGAELDVFTDFNFRKYKFRYLSVERPCSDLQALLKSNRYEVIAHIADDVFFAHGGLE